ncbi:MAG: hypothetical protein QF733_02885 [Phycisphaerales bacterium]|jgi:type II secretion system protein J|nr:hypothetical protein [Phycisphaerales bacterium]
MRRGFTMVEFLLAGVLLAAVLVAMGVAMQQVVKSKNATRDRIDAHLRADSALRMVRRDLASVLRREDLFYTRVLLLNADSTRDGEVVARDEILLFNNRLQATRDITYNGDGLEFETHYRVEEDDLGPMLLARRDPMPDGYPRGGGIVTPVVEGVTEMDIEAWNGISWHEEWDSDEDGLPWAFRVTVTATGAEPGLPTAGHPIATLRTVVPVDRSRMPFEVADARLAEDIMDRFGLEPELYDDVVNAVATSTPPPIPRTPTATPGGGLIDTDGTSAASGGGVPGQTIETPAGTVIIGPDGNATLNQGGSGGSPR